MSAVVGVSLGRSRLSAAVSDGPRYTPPWPLLAPLADRVPECPGRWNSVWAVPRPSQAVNRRQVPGSDDK